MKQIFQSRIETNNSICCQLSNPCFNSKVKRVVMTLATRQFNQLDNSVPATNPTQLKLTNERVTSADKLKIVPMEYSLETFQRSNQDTSLTHKPSVFEGNWVQSGDLLTDCASSVGGELSLGQNILVAYMPWEGYNFEDAILISERLVIDDLYTSVHIERYDIETYETKLGFEQITRDIPDVSQKEIEHLDSFGIVKMGAWVEEGDILVGKVTPINKKTISSYQKLLYTILEKQIRPLRDSSLRAPKGIKAKVIDIKYFLRAASSSSSLGKTKSMLAMSCALPLPQSGTSGTGAKAQGKLKTKRSTDLSFLEMGNNKMNTGENVDKTSRRNVSNKVLKKINQTFLRKMAGNENYKKNNLLTNTGDVLSFKSTGSEEDIKYPAKVFKAFANSKNEFKHSFFKKMNQKEKNNFITSSFFTRYALSKKMSLLQARKLLPLMNPNKEGHQFQKMLKSLIKRTATSSGPFSYVSPSYISASGTKSFSQKTSTLKQIETIHIYLAEKRKIQVGDKMAGRHGNKGIVSQILPIQDMPYLPDGTPLDMVLNPLGVPSRMNVGQIYECLLGLAGKFLGEQYKIFSFDESYGPEASRAFVFNKLYEARTKTGLNWLFDPNSPGKIRLYDGRTGDYFDQKVTVGQAYMLRLVHMVDDKIHMRSTGPYSLVTQQPLRGRSKQGGQRLGEMEVWAIEGYGAAFTLLEMLTIKSDDMTGRMTLWSNLILNKDISIGTPESFKVLICELQALCLDIGLFRYNETSNPTQGTTKNSLREITSLINLP